jgi:hypothetical protein
MTSSEVVALAKAYYASGKARPGYSGWYLSVPDGPPLACLLTAAYLGAGHRYEEGGKAPWDAVHAWALTHSLSVDEFDGLLWGFDYGWLDTTKRGEAYERGVCMGVAAREELRPTRMPQACDAQ